MAEPDGSNPLARIDVTGTASGTLSAGCDCGVELTTYPYEINLQDLVMAAGDHARVCTLHLANLAAIEKEKNRG